MKRIRNKTFAHARMAVPFWKIAFGAIGLILMVPAMAQTVRYYDGGTSRSVTQQPDLVADISGSGQATTSAAAAAMPSGSPMVTIRTLGTPTSRAAEIVASQSPVFREGNSPAGRLMTLPGGVIVNFKSAWSDAQVLAWATSHGHTIRHRLNILGNWYVLGTAPGLPSLNAANSIQESGEVISATPNWWRETVAR